jgi:hypothetical protein
VLEVADDGDKGASSPRFFCFLIEDTAGPRRLDKADGFSVVLESVALPGGNMATLNQYHSNTGQDSILTPSPCTPILSHGFCTDICTLSGV